MRASSLALLLALSLVAPMSNAQNAASQNAPRQLTAADYDRAVKMLPDRTTPLVDGAAAGLVWSGDDLVYRQRDAKSDRLLRLRDGKTETFVEQAALAAALSQASGKPVKAAGLSVSAVKAVDGGYEITSAGNDYRCDAAFGKCELLKAKGGDEPAEIAPNGKVAAFVRDWNLWLRDLATGKETQLTKDGVKDYGYATDNAGWKHTDNAVLQWSPDSTKIATFQQDQRKTSTMTMVHTNIGAPKVQQWKYPFPGDKDVTMIERVVIDVGNPAAPKVVRLKMEPDQHRSTFCDDVACGDGWEDVQWSHDGKSLAFVSTDRAHKSAQLRMADPVTGAVRDVFNETVKTQFESGQNAVGWKYLSRSNEFLWSSERSNWQHLYLYDMATGKLKRQVTSGDWLIGQLVRVDEASRTAWFNGFGREPGNPYLSHLYRVSLDGGDVTLLTPENAYHQIKFSPDGKRFVDTYSTATTPPVTVVRDAMSGKVLNEIARADISRLKASGWQPLEDFTVKARDGKTDLYGQMFKPSNFDAKKKYPVVVYIYPGPQSQSVRARFFIPSHGDHQALAELGFVVIAIDGMGTPLRSKSFHDTWYGDMGDNTLPDQVAGVKQLAKRYPWIDIDRVGIWGHSGGGYATAGALLRYPDFFKVGIAEAGNHDNRSYEDDWGERYIGLLTKDKDGKSNYDDQANATHAKGLKGKLFLIHGMMDDNVPVQNTLLLADALMKENKDFDMLLLPQARHGFGQYSNYITRRRWDYFVEHLMGAKPPQNYVITPAN